MRKLIIGAVLLIFYQCKTEEASKETLFQKLDSTATNIAFTNAVSPRKGKFSVVDYFYYYNGAGVAAGDINNDGLTDLFFVSNEHGNKLYLNKGNFNFEDISATAGVKGFASWKTGVTMADVNGDGLLDIYVCAVGDYLGLEGSNELYINNGDLTFSEKSSQYGLDFTGFSTQAAFFDYDHDNDLDMYLLTHGRFLSRSYTNVIADLLPEGEAVDFLFRNDGEKFSDVSDQSGIRKAARGYGLGISVADLNDDGWEDIYVTNDFYEADNYFLNNRDGTFREEGKQLFGHFSHFSRGIDIADMNNDGFEDVMTVDVSSQDEAIEKSSFRSDSLNTFNARIAMGYHKQYSRNALHVNNTGRNFSDLAPFAGVASTDYSWSTLLADYDNDGNKDIFVTAGTAARLNDLEYLAFARLDSMRYAPQLSEHQLDRNMKRIPARKFHNYLYKGNNDLIFEDRSEDWGMNDTGLANGAVYVDLDNDGDLDLVTNNINEPAGVYRNRSNEFTQNNYLAVQLTGQGKNTFGVGAKVYIKSKDGFQLQHVGPNRGFLSSVSPVMHFGLGGNSTIDSLVVVWNDGKTQVLTSIAANKKILIDYGDAVQTEVTLNLFQKKAIIENIPPPFQFVHKENKYSDFYREKLIPFLVSMEGPKITIGDVNNDGLDDVYIGGAKRQAGSLFIQKAGGDFQISRQQDISTDSIFEDTDAAFFDADNDNDLDLYVVSGGNEFYGEMDKQFDRLYLNDGKGNFKRDKEALPPMYENKSCVRPHDFDGDGDLDLFVGGRVVGYNYGKAPRSFLLSNDGKGKFTDVTATMSPGLERAGMITDAVWVGDDLIIVGDWMPVRIFKKSGNSFVEEKDIIDPQSAIKNISGWWQCVIANDFDGDGDTDLIAGNLGMNSTFRKNGDQSIVQNPVNPDPLISDQFASLYFENTGKNKFLVRKLPNEIQTSKVFSLYAGDVNNDGHLDVLAGGNFSGASMYQGNYDASHGVLLLGDGKGNFSATTLNIDGEIRDIKPLDTKSGKIYLVAINNGPIQALSLRKK